MASLGVLTVSGFLSNFQNRSARNQIAKKCNSYRNLQMSKVFDTKPQHEFFYGVPQGLGVLMWYFGGIFDHFLSILEWSKMVKFLYKICVTNGATLLPQLMRHNVPKI